MPSDPGAFQPVRCDRCGTEVLVGKTSWQQTSVQWPSTGAVCPELRAGVDATGLSARARGCGALQRSIAKAALAGTLTIAE